ncbi:hypothetical protein [Aquimarina algiphila]|uniref:hypothetical protein n=1 Tax=Aquimarina algiphila TaxID=2047982 RepID=UPI00232F661A|nr:hypothetical protein [Aquimarina algiphila]
MKCLIHLGNKQDANGLVIRRKFVPIKLTIHRENQFLNAEAKLPFATNAVIGILTTSNVQKKCSDVPGPSRLYYGVSPSKMEDTSFLELNPGTTYTTNYPRNVTIEEQAGGWWYYAHPVTDTFPFIVSGDIPATPRTPIIIDVLQSGQCTPEKYYLWSYPFYGYAFISFNAPIP